MPKRAQPHLPPAIGLQAFSLDFNFGFSLESGKAVASSGILVPKQESSDASGCCYLTYC
jgi:hypothetical protein